MRCLPVASAEVICTDAVAADARLKRPRLTTTSATSNGCSAGPVVGANTASDAVFKHGSGIGPVDPGGGKVTSRLATTAPVRTLMNCSVKSALTAPTFAAHSPKCWPASTGNGGLASRYTTAYLPQQQVQATASPAIK
jgi:hypothetical protein